jgi:hypothetical protein
MCSRIRATVVKHNFLVLFSILVGAIGMEAESSKCITDKDVYLPLVIFGVLGEFQMKSVPDEKRIIVATEARKQDNELGLGA